MPFSFSPCPVITSTFKSGSNCSISESARKPSRVSPGEGGKPRSSVTTPGFSFLTTSSALLRSSAIRTSYLEFRAQRIWLLSSSSSSTINILGFSISLSCWEQDSDLRSRAYAAVNLKNSVMRFHDQLAMEQSDAQPFLFCCLKWLEQRFF